MNLLESNVGIQGWFLSFSLSNLFLSGVLFNVSSCNVFFLNLQTNNIWVLSAKPVYNNYYMDLNKHMWNTRIFVIYAFVDNMKLIHMVAISGETAVKMNFHMHEAFHQQEGGICTIGRALVPWKTVGISFTSKSMMEGYGPIYISMMLLQHSVAKL